MQKVAADQKVSPAPAPLVVEQTEQKNEVSTRVVPPKARRKFRTPIVRKLCRSYGRIVSKIPHLFS